MAYRNFRLPVALIGLVFLTAVSANPASANSERRDSDRNQRSDYNYHHRDSDRRDHYSDSNGWYDSHGEFHRYERHDGMDRRS
jgi:hypothetical protein